MNRKDDYRLVYSTEDGDTRKKFPETPGDRKVVSAIEPSSTTLKLRLEKKNRGGKSVTVLFDLPHNPDYAKKLCKKLKASCGTGGAVKGDDIEIQGDQRAKMAEILEKMGFSVKMAGG